MSSMLKRAWSNRRHNEAVEKVKAVRKEAREAASSANKESRAMVPKERSRSSRCYSVCNKMSDAMYVDY